MFLEINGLAYNLMFTQSIDKLDEDGKYKILYAISNENKLIEEFDNAADRDAKYELAQKLGSTSDIEAEIEQIEQDIRHLEDIGFHPLIVEELPTEDIKEFILYLVPKETEDEEDEDIYDEWLYIQGEWEHIGTTSIDLSDYYTKSEIDSKFFNGKQSEWDALTQQEKESFLIAVVENGAELSEEDIQNLNNIEGENNEYEMDMSIDEALSAFQEIAGVQ